MTKTSQQMADGFKKPEDIRARNLRRVALAEGRLGAALELEHLYLDPELSEADIVTALSQWIRETKKGNEDDTEPQ